MKYKNTKRKQSINKTQPCSAVIKNKILIAKMLRAAPLLKSVQKKPDSNPPTVIVV